jgi:hypothetical protein
MIPIRFAFTSGRVLRKATPTTWRTERLPRNRQCARKLNVVRFVLRRVEDSMEAYGRPSDLLILLRERVQIRMKVTTTSKKDVSAVCFDYYERHVLRNLESRSRHSRMKRRQIRWRH